MFYGDLKLLNFIRLNNLSEYEIVTAFKYLKFNFACCRVIEKQLNSTFYFITTVR